MLEKVYKGESLHVSKSVLLVDGMAVLFRAYFASAYGGYVRKTKAGVPVNAIYGFARYLFDVVRTYEPTHVAVCWDLSGKTFRTERYALYIPL